MACVVEKNYPEAPTCCESGSKCVAFDENFHQCIPEFVQNK
jgi:hypothetical protein